MLRTQQTAQIISGSLHRTYITLPQLRERANWGDDPTQTFAQFLAMWNQATQDRTWIPPVGDSAKNAGERMSSIIANLYQNEEANTTVLVTHGGIIGDFLSNEFTLDKIGKYLPDFPEQGSQAIHECSITLIGYDGVKFYPAYFASTQHLLI